MNALKTLQRVTLHRSYNHVRSHVHTHNRLASAPFRRHSPKLHLLSHQPSRAFCDKQDGKDDNGNDKSDDVGGEEQHEDEGGEEEDPEVLAAKAQAELRAMEKRTAKEESKRYASERAAYEKKLKKLRKLFAEEHERKGSKTQSKAKTFKKNVWAKPYPPEMLPKIKLPRELTPEWLEKMAAERRETKAERRKYELERRAEEKLAKEEREKKIVEKLEEEVEMWLSERDLESPTLFEAKVAVQLENLVPMQEAFYDELPSQPFKFYNMYHRDEVVRETLTADRHLPTAEPDSLDELLAYDSDAYNTAASGGDAGDSSNGSGINRSGGKPGGASGQPGADNTDGSNGRVKSSEILQILQEMENKPKDKAD